MSLSLAITCLISESTRAGEGPPMQTVKVRQINVVNSA